MNYIQRNKDSLPKLSETSSCFKKEITGMTREEAYKHYDVRKNVFKYNTKETTGEFKKMNYERCSFCTKLIQEFDSEMTVEHIETKKDKPEKIFEWTNLLCACRTCNTKRSTNRYDDKKYLDPTKVEDIEKYFCYNADGSISVNEDLTEEEKLQAKYMIDLYKLDRESLNVERRKFLYDLQQDEDFYKGLLKQDMDSRRIVFRCVFTYYKRRIKNGK